jgi:hypothetical protein
VTQRAFAVFFALHGAVHAIGFTVAWQIGGPRGVEYSTALLNGAVEIGGAGTRMFGLVWLAATAAFLGVAALLWRRSPLGRPLATALLLGSLILCALGLPESVIGLAVDIALLGLLAIVPDRLVAHRPADAAT